MDEDAILITESGQSKCRRCGRWFLPKTADQEYGEKCMRYVVPPRKKRHKKSHNVSPEEDAVRAYRGAVIV
jgi:uncharacterized OB-fold protein